MNWRIYRLPGSHEFWHIDSGAGTPIFNVKKWQAAHTRSIDVCGWNVPRAWVFVGGQELHLINGVAVFEFPGTAADVVREALENNGIEIENRLEGLS